MILLNKTKQEFNTSKLARISNIVLELIALRTKKPGMTNATEVNKKNFVCWKIDFNSLPSSIWTRLVKITGIKIKEIESFMSKKKDSSVRVTVGNPTPMVPLTRPPKKKIPRYIKKR